MVTLALLRLPFINVTKCFTAYKVMVGRFVTHLPKLQVESGEEKLREGDDM